jgi:LytS/YehU family sensor histidine kinase
VGFPIGKVIGISSRVIRAIAQAVPVVEAASQTFGRGSNAEKKSTVMDVVRAELEAASVVVGVDLANDPAILAAAGQINDAYVDFHKILARRITAGGGTP